MQNPDPKTAGQYQTLLILWFAFVASQFFFLILIYFTKPALFHLDVTKPLLGSSPILVGVIAAASLFCLYGSITLGKKYLNQSVEKQSFLLLQTGLIISYALCEAVFLYGVFLAFAIDYQYFFVFLGVGILGTLLNFPRRRDIESANFKKLS